jgi:hypothetical protein
MHVTMSLPLLTSNVELTFWKGWSDGSGEPSTRAVAR